MEQEKAKIYTAMGKIDNLPTQHISGSKDDDGESWKPIFYADIHLSHITKNIDQTGEYFELIQKIGNSNVKIFKNEGLRDFIINQILQNPNGSKLFQTLENSYIINDDNCRVDFPNIYEIYTTFSILQNKEEIIRKVGQDFEVIHKKGEGVGSKYLKNYANDYPKLLETFYKVFMKISINSANNDFIKYIDFLKKGQSAIGDTNETELAYNYLNNTLQLANMFIPGKVFDTIVIDKSTIKASYQKVKARVDVIGKTLGYSFAQNNLLESIEILMTAPLGLQGFDGIVQARERSKQESNQKAEVLGASNLILEKGDMIKGINSQYIESYFHNGLRCPEGLGDFSKKDLTWFDMDLGVVDEAKGSLEETISSNIAGGYGDGMYFIIKSEEKNFVNTEFMNIEETKSINLNDQDELIANHFAHKGNYSLLGGLGINKVSAIVLKEKLIENEKFMNKLKTTIAMSGVYKPIYNIQGKNIFSKGDFDFMQPYGKVLNGEFPSTLQQKINRTNILKKSPEEIFTLLESYTEIKQRLDMDVGTAEGYTLGEHTKMGLNQFYRYIKGRGYFDNAVISEEMFVAMYLYHDGGKPLSILYEGDGQHTYTKKNIGSFLKTLGFTNIKEVIIASEIASQDIIGDLIRGNIDNKIAIEKITKLANKLGISNKKLFDIMKLYAMIDGSAYTSNAGGRAGFGFNDSFDFNNGNVEYKGAIKEKVDGLETIVNK